MIIHSLSRALPMFGAVKDVFSSEKVRNVAEHIYRVFGKCMYSFEDVIVHSICNKFDYYIHYVKSNRFWDILNIVFSQKEKKYLKILI